VPYENGRRRGDPLTPRKLFAYSLALGALLGFGTLIGGMILTLPALFVWLWIARRPRFVSASGSLIGFGGSWLLFLGRAASECAGDVTCTPTDITPWLLVSAALGGVGVLLGILSFRRLEAARYASRPEARLTR
jgi:hypothetical protein